MKGRVCREKGTTGWGRVGVTGVKWWLRGKCILVPRAHDPSDLGQASRALNLVPRASFPLTSGRKTRALGASISGMHHRYHTCRLRTARACAVKPDMQNSVTSIVIWKWMLPELSFSDRWSRGTKLWERDCKSSWLDLIFWVCAGYSSHILSQSDFLDLTGSPWIMDFRCWTRAEISIPAAGQKDRGLWEPDRGKVWEMVWEVGGVGLCCLIWIIES